MENNYTNLPTTYEEDIKMKPINDFEFIRKRNFYKENTDIKNIIQKKPFSILEKTNNIFGNKLYTSPIEQKENINIYSNQNNINANINDNFNDNINTTIKRIQNRTDKHENDIKQIYKNNNQINLKDKQNFEEKIITNNNININNDNNKYNINNIAKNKDYYFNYRNDESFNKLNEQNTKSFPVNVKLHSLYNTSNDYITSINNKNFEFNELHNFNYKGYLNPNFNEMGKRNELNYINKNTFESIDINNNKEYNSFNDLRNDHSSRALSVKNNIIKRKQLNLDYDKDENNNNLQTYKPDNNLIDYNYNNKTNNNSLYNTEKRDNIKSYFQLKQNKEYEDCIYNYNNYNNITSLNKSNETLSSLADESKTEKDNKNVIKNLKNYHSFSTPKNLHINHKINNSENKKDEMTQTIPTNDDELYNNINNINNINAFTPNRAYRNKFTTLVDTPSQTFDNNVELKRFNTFMENSNKINEEINKENIETNNINKMFNTVSNNGNNFSQHNKHIFKCNSFRHKKNKNMINTFNRNICEKCLKSKMNLAQLSQMRICKNCQNLINSNYLTFN